MHRRASAAGVVVLSLSLGGCLPGLGDDPVLAKLRSLEGGECIADDVPSGLNVMNEVPCLEPHVWEILGTVPVPGEFADADIDDLVTADGLLIDELFWQGLQECVPLAAQWSGLAAQFEDVTTFRNDPMLWPAFNGQVAVTLPPEDAWPTFRRLVCAVEWSDIDGTRRPLESETVEPVIARFATASMPAELRVCTGPDPAVLESTDCTRPHVGEVVFTFEAPAVLGDDLVDVVDPGAMSEKDWLPFDQACWSAEDAVFGAHRSQQDVILLADIAPDSWGAGVLRPETRTVMCIAVPNGGTMLLDGPVWDLGSVPAPLVTG